jgi:ADP-ribose pyrophosphatase YjhB (NUDIX family)
VGQLDGWRFCPRCGGELAPVDRRRECGACGARYWGNSIPGVQGILERDGRILLARRAREPRRGLWDLPGGFLEEGEAPLEGLRREFREETGLDVEAGAFVGVELEPYDGRSVVSLTWIVTAAAGEPRAADDVEEVRWFSPAELPAEMAFPGQDRLLAAWVSRSL